MKLSGMRYTMLGLAATLSASSAQERRLPVQAYYVPLPEEELLKETLVTINDGTMAGVEGAAGPVKTLISIAIAADKTVVWYDHWEDGYDGDIAAPMQTSTMIWGDGDCSNGYAPNIKGKPVTSCNGPEDDTLSGGDSIILENSVPVNPSRDPSSVFFDAGDLIKSSFAIAVTKAAYPETPGSLMAGSVEVLDTTTWGKEFIAPVGKDTVYGDNNPFEYTALYVMACKDKTEVLWNGASQGFINQGENMILYPVGEGDEVDTTHDTQVSIIAGDVKSSYEMRWYSLVPTSGWSSSYFTPVGGVETKEQVGKHRIDDSERQTKVWIFNPHTSTLKVNYDVRGNSGTSKKVLFVKPGASNDSIEIPVGSGAKFYQDDGLPFFGLTQTHTGGTGQIFDWGHPLVAEKSMTSQALVGWGYGCEGNNCNQGGDIAPFKGSRSVVWVTPVDKADIYVDFGDGVVKEMGTVKPLASIRIADEKDHDMTGAVIWAERKGSPVKMVAAWGQDPSKSTFIDPSAMDLGTAVPPLPILSAGKTCVLENDVNRDGQINPGDSLKYTIRVVNMGRVTLGPNSFSIYDFASPLLDEATYVPNSATYTSYNSKGGVEHTSSVGGSSFPLNDGVPSKYDIVPNGVHEISFVVQIKDMLSITPGTEKIVNKGVLAPQGFPDDPIDKFEEEKPIVFVSTTSSTSDPNPNGGGTTTEEPKKTTTECPLTPVIDGEKCRPLLVGDGIQIGVVCAEIVGGFLEISKKITTDVCCISECHICNLPTETWNTQNECSRGFGPVGIPIERVYDFVCAFDEDTFVVAGHATAVCNVKYDEDEVITESDRALIKEAELSAYYEIPLKCEC